MKKTPMVMLPREESAEIIDVIMALLGISGNARTPTVALKQISNILIAFILNARKQHRRLRNVLEQLRTERMRKGLTMSRK